MTAACAVQHAAVIVSFDLSCAGASDLPASQMWPGKDSAYVGAARYDDNIMKKLDSRDSFSSADSRKLAHPAAGVALCSEPAYSLPSEAR
jgi:hypothetical protein